MCTETSTVQMYLRIWGNQKIDNWFENNGTINYFLDVRNLFLPLSSAWRVWHIVSYTYTHTHTHKRDTIAYVGLARFLTRALLVLLATLKINKKINMYVRT